MWTRGRVPESFPIVYCKLRPLYSGNFPILNYGHCSCATNGQNQYEFPSESGQSWLTGVKQLKIVAVLEDFSRFYPSYNVSRPLCTQGVLNFQTRGILRLERVIITSYVSVVIQRDPSNNQKLRCSILVHITISVAKRRYLLVAWLCQIHSSWFFLEVSLLLPC